MNTEFRNETISIEITDNNVVIVDEAGTYKFTSVKAAQDWCQQVVESGNGEWWVSESEEALSFLMQHA